MEIAAVVGGALLSVSFEKLVDKLASPEMRQFFSKKEVQSQLHEWKVMLPKIHAVLEDAEQKETTTPLVNIWLSELRDLVYDVEDVLDEFATEALRIKHQASETATTPSSSKNKVHKILPSWLTAGPSLKMNARIGSKLKEITARLETICTQKTNLHLLDKAVGGRRGRSEDTTRVPTTSLPDSHIFGRDKDKQALLDLLLADGDAAAGMSVIPLQGMGGLGKTTLAQQLYHDDKVKVHFQLKAWVCVSDTFDILNITRTILQYVGSGGTHDGKTLDQLQVDLEKALSEKKFFLVLDDVWNEKYEDWTILYKPFRGGAPGSKIIVTTRNQQVADLAGTTQAYRLGVLSGDDCLSLFAQHALGATNFDGHLDLEDVGRKIVEKCKGLPLAAKTLGGLLRTKFQHDEWVDILESRIWDLPEEKSDILPALRLSYHHLPSQLKQCFAYCAIFPKDYSFDRDELVLFWMAEGFLSHPRTNKCLEDVGAQYFCDLLSRSFFQPLSENSAKFVMHDLIHDLAQVVAGEICFHLDGTGSVESGEHLPTMKTRHSSFIQRYYEVQGRFGVFDEAKGLRTLLTLPTAPRYDNCCVSVDVLNILLSKLGNLRALSLRSYYLRVVPRPVIDLKHLRYLDLSQTAIRLLPEFVCSLLNLQTLLLTNCDRIEKLPARIGDIPNLCHLDIHGTRQLKEMPPGIGNLTEIRTLGKFIVGSGKADGLNIRELKTLSQLKGELSLEGLHNIENSEDAREADLKGKQGLQRLVMRWSDNMDDHMSSGSVETKVLELLQPHRKVERLAIEFYCGSEFPSWLGDPLLMSNMKEIELRNCGKSTWLPSLGRLPMLKHLIIKGMGAVKTLGFEFFGCDDAGFAALETLKFEDMEGWEKWCSVGPTRECRWKFPCLRELEMLNCPVLVGECLVSVPSLRKLKLKKCNESFLKCIVDTGSLSSLSIGEMPGLSCVHDSVGQLLVSLEDLEIYNCEDLVCLWKSEAEIEDSMSSLRSLEVRSCPELVSLVTTATINKMAYLEKMIVKECPRIQIDQQQGRNGEVKFPPKLRHLELDNCGDQVMECVGNGEVVIGDECVLFETLRIKGCDTLQHLAIKSRNNYKRVEGMRIEDCRNLVSLSNSAKQVQQKDDKIVEIGKVEILNCQSLTSAGLKLLVAVKILRLYDCSQLESVAEALDENHKMMNMPWTKLEDITIKDCPNLKTLPDRMHQLTNLTFLYLRGCDGLELFPEMGLPFPNLSSLQIHNCQNLKSMPNNTQCLTTLTSLAVSTCRGLKSFPGEGSLPPNLIELLITRCPNVKQKMSEWKLGTLSLTTLWIEDFGDGDFTDMLLPTTLRVLHISSFPKLKSISSTSYASSSCFHLHKNLTSLAYLYIRHCPKLRCLPKEGLPLTLQSLRITNCPILEKKCLEEKGKYWSRIARIPHISIK